MKLKRITALIAAFTLLFLMLPVTSVFAIEEGERVYLVPGHNTRQGGYGDFYYIPSGNGVQFVDPYTGTWHGGAWEYIGSKEVSGTGELVYCIEKGTSFNGGNRTGKLPEDSTPFDLLNNDAKRGIQLVMLYGYPNRSLLELGVSHADDAIAATQVLLWEYECGFRVNSKSRIASITKNDKNGTSRTYSGNQLYEKAVRGTPAENAYNAILAGITSHMTFASFTSDAMTGSPITTLQYDSVSGKYKATLTDTNNSGAIFQVPSPNPYGIAITKSGSSYTITADSEISTAQTIQLRRTNVQTSVIGVFLVFGESIASDQLIAAGASDPVKMYMRLQTESRGNLSILKTTQHNGGSVSGFTFEVRNSSNTLIGTYTTTATGVITIPDLEPGVYSVKEINLSSDYIEPSPNPKSVTVIAGQTASVSFDNVKKRGVITVRKTDASPAMGGYSLAGAVFEVRDAGGALVDTITTGTDGRAQTKILPLGVYRVREVTAPYGYVRDTGTYTSTLSGTLGTGEIVYAPDVTIAEQPQVGRINIEKYNNAPDMGDYALTGAVFEIRSGGGTLVDTVTTDAQGRAQSKDLKLGDYTVTEKSAPYGYARNTGAFNVSLTYGGQEVSRVYAAARVPQRPQTGIVRIRKLNATPDMGGYSLAGAVFEVRAAQDIWRLDGTALYRKGDLADTVTTSAAGEAQTKELPLGAYTVREKTAPYGFVLNVTEYDAILSYAGQETSVTHTDVTVAEQPQVGTITITKLDTVTGTRAQGDSTLSGAVFEVYSDADELVDTLYCAGRGSSTSKELPLGDYYYREKTPPVGYTLDPDSYPVTIEYQGQNVSVVRKYGDLSNKVVEGQIALVKHTNDPDPDVSPSNPQAEAPLEGAVFEVFLKSAGGYDNAFPTERDRITTNADGYAQTKRLPYGVYTVREIHAPGDVKLVEPFEVFISMDGAVYRYILSDPWFRSLVKVIKADSETGRQIPAAGVSFKVRDLSTGEWVSQSFNYPAPITIDVFETAPDGTLVMPEALKSGGYELWEQAAPHGYILSKDPVTFTIHSTQSDPAIAEIIMANAPAKGIIKIKKTGNMLTGNTVTETSFGKQYTPVFSLTGLSGAVFNVVAAEDVYTGDGTLRSAKGTVVDTITTGADGGAQTKQLYLGDYELVEVMAPAGFVFDDTPHPVSLVFEGQEVPVVYSQIGIDNARQTVEIELHKRMEKRTEDYQNVIFGLFAGEDIMAADGGTVIPNGSLVALMRMDENGKGVVAGELPFAKYYVRELATAPGYVLDNAKYDAVFKYAGQDVATVAIAVNGGEPVENRLLRGGLKIVKTFEGRVMPIAGVPFTVTGTSVAGIPFESAFETDENGEILIEGLPVGKYTVREIASALTVGYILSGEQTATVAADTLAEMRIDNRLIRGDVKILKTDAATGEPLAGAVFGLYDADGTLIAEGVTDEGGIAAFLGIPYGEYEIREISAPEGYRKTGEAFSASITENGQVITIEIDNDKIPRIPDIPQTGDSSHAALWFVLMGASVLVGAVTVVGRKKAKEA